MPTAERPPQLINPYGCEPDPDEESSGPARVAGRALIIGTLGIGAATAITGTGFADDGRSNPDRSDSSSNLDSPDVISYASSGMSSFDVPSTDSSSDDSNSYTYQTPVSYEAPVQQVVSVEPVESFFYRSSDGSGGTGSDSGDVAPLTVSTAPVKPEIPIGPGLVGPLWDEAPVLLPVDPPNSDPASLEEWMEELLSVPEAPVMDPPPVPQEWLPVPNGWHGPAPVEPDAPVEPVPGSNGSAVPETPAGSPLSYQSMDGSGGSGSGSGSGSDSSTGVPASRLVMPTVKPITTFLLPGYQGDDAEVSTPSFTDQSKLSWVDKLKTVDTNPGSPTFGKVVPRSDDARSVSDFQPRDVPGRTLSPYILSTPPFRVPLASGPTAAPTPVPLSESLNIDRVGASGPSFGTSNTSLADTLQIRSGGPSSDDMFFSTASSRLPGLQDGGMLVASSAVSDSGGLSSANGSPALVTPDSGRLFTLTPEGELYASETVGSPMRPIPLRDVKRPSSTLQVVPPFKEFICGMAEWVCAPSSVQHNPPGTIIMIPVGAPGSPRQPVLTDKDTYKLCWTSKHDCAVYEPHGKGQLMQKIEGAHGTPHYLPSGQVPRRLRP